MPLMLKDLKVGESFEITDDLLNGETGTVIYQTPMMTVAELNPTTLLPREGEFPMSSTLLCRRVEG